MEKLLLAVTNGSDSAMSAADAMHEVSEEIAVAMLVGIVIAYLAVGFLLLVNYILVSLGVYNIAKNHNINNAGLAWIPIGREYVKGAVIDCHSKNKRNFDSKWRVKYPVFTAVPIAIVWVAYVIVVAFAVMTSMDPDFMDTPDEAVPLIIVMLVAYVAMIICALLANTVRIICDYKVYEEIIPKRAFLYTILGLLIPLAQGICLLTCKKYGTGESFDTNDMTFGAVAQPIEPTPAVKEIAPVVESAPAVEELATVAEETAPAVEEAAPAVEEAAPVVEETAPVVEDSCGETEILTPDEETASDTDIFTE